MDGWVASQFIGSHQPFPPSDTWRALHCIALRCAKLHCNALHCKTLQCIGRHCCFSIKVQEFSFDYLILSRIIIGFISPKVDIIQEFFEAFFGSRMIRAGDKERAEDEFVCFGDPGIKEVKRIFYTKSLTVKFSYTRVMISFGAGNVEQWLCLVK